MLTSFFKIIIILFSLIFFISCTDSDSGKSSPIHQPIYKNFAILGPLSDADVKISYLDSNETIFSTKTNLLTQVGTQLKWGEYGVGSFDIDLSSETNRSKWIVISVENGSDVDVNDDGEIDVNPTANRGKLSLYCRVEDINKSTLIVNAFTTIAATLYEHNSSTEIEKFLNDFANDVFVSSVDEFSGVDYRDLYAYIPNHTSINVLKNPFIYDSLIEYNFLTAVLNDENITQILLEDLDGDSLSFLDEMLYNSNPNLVDTDGDKINDAVEINLGLNPSMSDSDRDTLSDYEEINIFFTNPLKADSDDDYLPDAFELANGTDALDADEDKNGVADGLDNDPFLEFQWYIKSLGTDIVNTASISTIVGNDLDMLAMHHHVVGSDGTKRIAIQVIDSGVVAHEDLIVDKTLSLNAINHTNDPSPTKALSSDPYSPADIGHGTAVAGIIGAQANNGLGIRGIAPFAKIAGSNWLEDESTEELEKVWYSQVNSDEILVSNNSWGAYVLEDYSYETILALASTELRNNKGRVFTFASGNFRKDFGNSNLSYLANNPYAITVASLNHKDAFSQYSNPGSNVLVSAYGGEYYYNGPTIMTTLLMGKSYYESELIGKKGAITVDEDSSRNYTFVMNGTSAATPMVSAIIGLTLEVCPDLTYRDIRWLIAHTSKIVDGTNTTWTKNAAGLWHSIDYGYGKIDGVKMLETCTSKYFKKLPKVETYSVNRTNLNTIIPDTNSSVVIPITFAHDIKVEWVGLTLEIDHPFAGDLEINLISPQGTKTAIMTLTETHYNAYKDGFRFSSVAFIDEDAKGTWNIEVIDRLTDDYGILKSVKLEIYGYEK